ncbi:HAD family hydrolase [Streptomyces caeruleatus]|uniref:HAD family hydrolase n=1 Tax=Streptomyces caeruleatus TaxID=661399 RepID=UPI0007C6EB9F|nr:HAD family phosphatase [Streptomyces caeruleatus]
MSREGSGQARIKAVVCDYGGVLTNPLQETFAAFARTVGVPLRELQEAFAAATAADGRSPMADLETGACTEQEMVLRVLTRLPGSPGLELLGGRPFGELWFQARHVNQALVDQLRVLRADGYTLALLTNNVEEWRPRWRAGLPVDELFHTVVDSSVEGVRKPDPEIYRRLLDRLPHRPEECLFIDDLDENCAAAEAQGMTTLLFTTTEDTVARLDALRDELTALPSFPVLPTFPVPTRSTHR